MNGELRKRSYADLSPMSDTSPWIKYPELHVKKLPAFLSNYDCLHLMKVR